MKITTRFILLGMYFSRAMASGSQIDLKGNDGQILLRDGSGKLLTLTKAKFDSLHLAQVQERPTCADKLAMDPSLPSGMYDVTLHDGRRVSAYCDMDGSESGMGSGGWMKIDAAYVTTNSLPLKASPFLFTNSPTTDSVVGSYTFSLPANTRGIRLVSVVEEFVSGPDGSGYSQTVGDSFKFIDGVDHSTEVMSWEQMYKLATDQVVDLGSNVGSNNVFFGDSGNKHGRMLRTTNAFGGASGVVTFTEAMFAKSVDFGFDATELTIFGSDHYGEQIKLKEVTAWVGGPVPSFQSDSSATRLLALEASLSVFKFHLSNSCWRIHAFYPDLASGQYQVTLKDGRSVSAYCDMDGSESGMGSGGWMKIDAAYVTTNSLPLKASPFLFTNSPTTDSVVGSYTFSLPANTRGIRLVSVVEEFVSGPDGSGYSQTVGDSFKFIDGVDHSTEVMSWEQMYKLATDQVVDLGSNVGSNNVFFGDSRLKHGRMLRTTNAFGGASGVVTFTEAMFAKSVDFGFDATELTIFGSDHHGEQIKLKEVTAWVGGNVF